MLDWPDVSKLFPADVISRAKEYMASIPGGTGAYSDSQGALILREQIAKVGFLCLSCHPPSHCTSSWEDYSRQKLVGNIRSTAAVLNQHCWSLGKLTDTLKN